MSRVSWQMGAEVKNAPEQNMVSIPVEEYEALIEAKTKLGVCARFFESDRTLMDVDYFNMITGFEILPHEKGEKNNGDTV